MNGMEANQDRVIFLDNIRYLMVLSVLVLHAAAAYSHIVPWWYVVDTVEGVFFDVSIIVLDIFLMPVLFFISGYFALPSLKRRGTSGFIIAKLRRLGVPLVLVGIFLAPIMPYIRYHGRTPEPAGFFEYWIAQLKTAVDFSVDHLNPVELATTTKYHDHLIQHHLWFLSLLLLFFMIFAAAVRVRDSLLGESDTKDGDTVPESRSMLLAMFFFGLTVSLVFTLVQMVSQDGSWAKIGSILLFQPTRVPIYIGLFCLGIYAYSRNWFIRRTLPGASWLWLVASLLLLLFFTAASRTFYSETGTIPPAIALLHGMLRTFFCLALIGYLSTSAYSCWNRPTGINRSLAASSYDIYLIHLPIVVLFQLGVSLLAVPVAVKFGLACAGPVLLSWGLSSRLIRPYPRLAVVVLLAAFSTVSILAR